MRPSDGATVLIHEATVTNRVEQLQHSWMRHAVFKEGCLVQTQLRTHRLRWYSKPEFVMMLESVGFREIVVRCGYTDGVSTDPNVDLVSLPSDNMMDESLLS